jgi:hypothetical protein
MATYKCKRCGNQITLSTKPGQCEFCGTSQFKLIGQGGSKFVTPDSGDLSSPPSSSGAGRDPSPLSSASAKDSYFFSKIPTSSKARSSSLNPSLPLYSGPTTIDTPPRSPSRPKGAFLEKFPIALSIKALAAIACVTVGFAGYRWWRARYDTSDFRKTVLQENFNSPKSWALTNGASIRNGGLYQRQARRNHYGASIWMGKTFQDVDFSADAIKTSGPNDIPYGLIGRVNGKDGQKFYYLFINGQGNFVMGKHAPENWFHRVGWQKNDAIKKGSRRNRLRLVMKDDLVIGFINGERVGSFQDADYKSGRTAVFSMRGRGPRIGVYFDNVLIRERVQPAKTTK